MALFYVYIITDPLLKHLYIGVTNNLRRRMEEHFEFKGTQNTWAARHNCFQLIYFEEFQYIDTAIKREKELKGWKRSKKEWLIQLKNPGMRIIKFSSKKRGSKY